MTKLIRIPLVLALGLVACPALTRKKVPVTPEEGGGKGSYRLGGSQLGGALRLGFSL